MNAENWLFDPSGQKPIVRLDAKEGAVRREEGMDRAEDHALDDWKDEAHDAIRRTCLTHAVFTVDHVWKHMTSDTHERRAMGAAMRRAVKAGFCEATGQSSNSQQPQCHRGPRMLWRSLIRMTSREN